VKTRILVMAALVTSFVTQAAGFQLDVGSARGIGMGDAVVATTDDAASLYYNPAGLAGRRGFDVSLGVGFIVPSISFRSDNTGTSTSTKSGVATPINAYVAYGFTDWLSIGVGLFNPYAAQANWPAGWEGAGLALSSNVQTFDINPSIAIAIHPRFKVAAGFQAMRGTVQIDRGFNFIDSTGQVSLGGAGWGYGWNFGFQVEVVEKIFTIGGSYRSGVQMDFTGRAHFTNIPVAFQSLLKDQPITSSVLMPETATFGIAIKPMASLRIGVQVSATTWNSFHDLTIKFEDPALTSPLPKNWESVASFAIGAEYDINPSFAVRIGYVYDPTPSPNATLTPDLPDTTRNKFSVGAGWTSGFGLSVDVAYQLVLLDSKNSTAPGFTGTYSGIAHVPALSLSYHL
jgi:long-chain fatty acid transport protein